MEKGDRIIGKTTISTVNTMTIIKELRDKYGFTPGKTVVIVERNGVVSLILEE